MLDDFLDSVYISTPTLHSGCKHAPFFDFDLCVGAQVVTISVYHTSSTDNCIFFDMGYVHGIDLSFEPFLHYIDKR